MIYKTTILGFEISDIPRIIVTKEGISFEVKILSIDFKRNNEPNIIELAVKLFGKIWCTFKMADIPNYGTYNDDMFIDCVKNGLSQVIENQLESICK